MDRSFHTLKSEGVFVFKAVFSSSEVKKMHSSLESIFKKNRNPSFFNPSINLSNCSSIEPSLNWIIHHPKLLNCIKKALNTDKIMYTSVLGVQKNMLSDWHKDDGTGSYAGGYFEKDPYNDLTCRVLRVAIYLQDHNSAFPGLFYRRGSHKEKSLSQGDKVCLETLAGDVTVFDVRLTHSGTFRSNLYKTIKNKLSYNNIKYLNALSSILRACYIKITKKEKYAIFTAFGIDNSNTISYSRNMMRNQIEQSSGNYHLPEEVEKLLNELKVKCASKHFNKSDFL